MPGELRRSQVWVGGARPGNAVYVPPPWEKVPDLLAAMETYIHGDDELHPLLQIAALHLQFETIHPYLDGVTLARLRTNVQLDDGDRKTPRYPY